MTNRTERSTTRARTSPEPPATDLVTHRLAEIQDRLDKASPGPWERGDLWRFGEVVPETFGPGRCAICGPYYPVWAVKMNADGLTVRTHLHRRLSPYNAEHFISSWNGELVAGASDEDTNDDGGIFEPADTAFIAHARQDIPALLAFAREMLQYADISPLVRELAEDHLGGGI